MPSNLQTILNAKGGLTHAQVAEALGVTRQSGSEVGKLKGILALKSSQNWRTF